MLVNQEMIWQVLSNDLSQFFFNLHQPPTENDKELLPADNELFLLLLVPLGPDL